MSREKKYIPNSKYNPVVQANKIDKLSQEIQRLGLALDALSRSHDNHITCLANFARHDIKNAILSMDSILTVTATDDFNAETKDSLEAYLEVIRNTIDNFARLVPFSHNGKFKLEDLIIGVELLTRADMQKQDVDFKLNFDRDSEYELEFPFQSILQMINNLVLNSLKSLEGVSGLKKVYLDASVENGKVKIEISDNGEPIVDNHRKRIFEYGFTTTGGSGIGLYHAKYICEQLNGEICLGLTAHQDATKTFSISLPMN